jgi:hypothetical protein
MEARERERDRMEVRKRKREKKERGDLLNSPKISFAINKGKGKE